MLEEDVLVVEPASKKTVVVEETKSDNEAEELPVDPLNYDTLLEELPKDEPQIDLINFRLRRIDFISTLRMLKV